MLSLTLEDFDVRERGGAGSRFGWSRLWARFDALRSLVGEWVLGDEELDGLRTASAVIPDGSFNLSDLLARALSLRNNPAGTAPISADRLFLFEGPGRRGEGSGPRGRCRAFSRPMPGLAEAPRGD